MSKSTVSHAANKPTKPRPDFPLFPHANGRWAKKVAGKLCYFGTWADDPQGVRALKLWNKQKDDLYAGTPQPQLKAEANTAGLRLHVLINKWLSEKESRVKSGRLSASTFGEYVRTGKILAEAFGRNRLVGKLSPDDFTRLYGELAETRGLVAIGNEITRIRSVFRWGFEHGLLENAVRFGSLFVKPSKAEIEKHKARNGHDDEHRTFTRDELTRILAEVKDKPDLRAMVLLAVNLGIGSTDLASLSVDSLDLESGWARSRRGKTGQRRGGKLWDETIEAVRAYLAVRPEPVDPQHADLLFINRRGRPFVRVSDGLTETGGIDRGRWANRTDIIGHRFAQVLRKLDINGRRGVYNLRHTAATVADEAVPDRQAVKYLLGHSGGTITDGYVHRPPSDERMEAVAAAVHAWLFGAEGGAK